MDTTPGGRTRMMMMMIEDPSLAPLLVRKGFMFFQKYNFWGHHYTCC